MAKKKVAPKKPLRVAAKLTTKKTKMTPVAMDRDGTVKPITKISLAAEASAAVQEAIDAGRWMVAAYRVTGGRLEVRVITDNFPVEDFDKTQQLLADNLTKLKTGK